MQVNRMKVWLYEVITGKRVGVIPSTILLVLSPLSLLYGSICMIRRWLYESRLLRQRRLPVPVICVGNIVAGGAGKTTLTITIAEILASKGVKFVVLCSGYGGRTRKPTLVSDGEKVTADVEVVGDEAYMLAERMLKWRIPVIAGRDRFNTGIMAVKRFHPELVLLDDGFQHLRLFRDLDVIVMDATNPFGTGRLLPAGTLREPKSVLRKASLILMSRANLADWREIREIKKISAHVPILTSAYLPSRLRRIGSDEDVSLMELRGKNVLALCSIGNPESFRRILSDLGCKVYLFDFPDHHLYSIEDLKRIERISSEFDLIVTTAKDEPKLIRLGFKRGLVLDVELKTDLQALESIILSSVFLLLPGRASADPQLQRG